VISFFTLYIIVNTLLYNAEEFSHRSVNARLEPSIVMHPNLPPGLTSLIASNAQNLTLWQEIRSAVQGWAIAADVFIVFLFAAMVMGFLLTVPHINFVIAFLHFIAVVMITHVFAETASVSFLIGAVWIGVILPFFIELWYVLRLFVFRTDFYYVRE
jgi:hypothetical protein